MSRMETTENKQLFSQPLYYTDYDSCLLESSLCSNCYALVPNPFVPNPLRPNPTYLVLNLFGIILLSLSRIFVSDLAPVPFRVFEFWDLRVLGLGLDNLQL